MQELKAEKPTESPAGTDVVTRLMARLAEEGFTTDQSPEEWEEFGEIIFKRDEKISIAAGETVFIFTRIPELNERILRQTSDSVVHTYAAKNLQQKALSVLQSTTVYHCLVCTTEQPYSEMLDAYVIRRGGATFIPVILVPEINQALYPMLEEGVGTVRPRIDYLQFLLGERREQVNMHRLTIQAFYVSIAVIAVLVVAIGFAIVMH
ncbi:MAG TPA: hypothetical protein VH087_07095 [Thermoanaerobaculia bacterium]|jgi:hypothetical protein|nr:hypothetical protein [Thermoanaerobaculia bacterium]